MYCEVPFVGGSAARIVKSKLTHHSSHIVPLYPGYVPSSVASFVFC